MLKEKLYNMILILFFGIFIIYLNFIPPKIILRKLKEKCDNDDCLNLE
jgi:hypothetical protein